MNDIRKQIIELIEPYMDKTLSEWCLIKSGKEIFEIRELDIIDIDDNLLVRDIYERNEDVGEGFMCFGEQFQYKIDKILGHYDITAVLKYIGRTRREFRISILSADFKYHYIMDSHYKANYPTGGYNYKIPNKPLHLYSEQEEKELLDLLLKL